MRADLLNEVLKRLEPEFGVVPQGEWLRKGRCPQCRKREVYTRADRPWLLRCGRLERCGWEVHVKDHYPELFDSWSNRFQASDTNPTAAADAYLQHGRGLSLLGLRDAYTQEYFRQGEHSTATVRFALPGGGWWERLIDQPGRFDRKARFAPGKSYQGQWWAPPHLSPAKLAAATEIWICEGIFDAIALCNTGIKAVSAMSCYNYPTHALAALRREIANGPTPNLRPKLIWAFDIGKAGTEYTRRFVAQARLEGWECGAAQPVGEHDGGKLDWNDLALRDRLGADRIELYRWHGDVLIAPTAAEKAFLVWSREGWGSFPFTFETRTWWATFDTAKIAETVASYADNPQVRDLEPEEKRELAAREAGQVREIANCAFRALYYQREEATDESCYYLRVDFPSDRAAIKGTFSGSSLSAGAEFKKRLISMAPGGIWTGSTQQLDRIMQRQLATIRTVEAIQFTGYSAEHGAYVFGDIGVANGRVVTRNEDDYFEFGDHAVKLRSSERLLRHIVYDPERLETRWIDPLVTAYGAKGLVTLAFWFGALFAEQIRRQQQSLAFLEITGIPGSGKSTLIEFLWKLYGRQGFEGNDPAKTTAAAMARILGKVGNMPVVLMEGDRDASTPHSKRFEWDELKTAYNGRSVRSRGVANGGMETFEPPFRGAIVIEQNEPVNASPAILERIMHIEFDKAGWGPATKAAAERLARVDVEAVSGFIVHAARREAEILERYTAAFAQAEQAMLAHPDVRNGRLAKNHAQLAGMLAALRLLVPIRDVDHDAARALIDTMLLERQAAIQSDHPVVELFWERFDYIQATEAPGAGTPIDHSRNPAVIAVNLTQFEQACGDRRLQLPPMVELKRHLKTSKTRKFAGIRTVNSRADKSIHCWCFDNPNTKVGA